MRGVAIFVTIAALTSTALAGPSHAAELKLIEAEGTQFKVTLTDGRVLRSLELVGATLTIATGDGSHRLRIDAVETDPGDPARGHPPASDVFLHTLSMQAADGSWSNICNPGPDSRRQAFPLTGRVRSDATIGPASPGAFEITCTGGAQGKCVRFGYHPWNVAEDGPSYDLYNACVRLVRADYAGDGRGTTRDGQSIDLYDSFSIQKPDNDPGQEFEAGWSRDGAVCVRHVRVKDNVSLDELEKLPALRNRTGEVCTEEFARAHGAIIFNRSAP
jgi:hypothetical protein